MPLIPSLYLTTDHDAPSTTHEINAMVAQFRQIDLFAGASVSELLALTRHFRATTARPGDVLERQDRPVRHWQLIVSGHALVQRDGTVLGLLGQGESWSEHSLMSGQRSPISVVAFAPLTLLTMPRRAFLALPTTYPLVGERIRTRAATSADRLALPVYRALSRMEEARW
jgi:CRP-like cAMP-binding protein